MAGENQNPGGENQNQGGDEGKDGQQQQGGGQPTAAWREKLAPELKGAKTLDKFKGNTWDEVGPALVNSYVNLEKSYGGAVRIPGENAKPEEWRAFFAKMGTPESPDKYGEVFQIPEGMGWDKTAEQEFLKVFHEEGLTPKQAKRIASKYLEYVQGATDGVTKQTTEAIQKAQKALGAKWGSNMQRNEAIVQRLVADHGTPELRSWLVESGAGNDPRWLEWAHSIGEQFLEAGFIKGDNLTVTSTDAKSELKSILDDKKHAYWDAKAGGHDAAVKRVSELYGIIYPD